MVMVDVVALNRDGANGRNGNMITRSVILGWLGWLARDELAWGQHREMTFHLMYKYYRPSTLLMIWYTS